MIKEDKVTQILRSTKTKDMGGDMLYELYLDEEKFNEVFGEEKDERNA